MIRILTVSNTTYNMNDIPDEVDDIRYCVLDYSNQDNVDYYFMPMVFLESFSAPAVNLRLGHHHVQVPLDWSIVIGEKHFGDIEIISLMSLNDRDFSAFCFNPLDGYMPEFLEIEITNVYPDVKWYFPKLKFGHLLAVPLNNTTTSSKPLYDIPNSISGKRAPRTHKGPLCAYIVRDINKLPDTLDIRKLF